MRWLLLGWSAGCAGRHVDGLDQALKDAHLTPISVGWAPLEPPPPPGAQSGEVIEREGHRYLVELRSDPPPVVTDADGTLWSVATEWVVVPNPIPVFFRCDSCCGAPRGEPAPRWLALPLPDGATWGGVRTIRLRTRADRKYLPLRPCPSPP